MRHKQTLFDVGFYDFITMYSHKILVNLLVMPVVLIFVVFSLRLISEKSY